MCVYFARAVPGFLDKRMGSGKEGGGQSDHFASILESHHENEIIWTPMGGSIEFKPPFESKLFHFHDEF